jgi:hypothetical protein
MHPRSNLSHHFPEPSDHTAFIGLDNIESGAEPSGEQAGSGESDPSVSSRMAYAQPSGMYFDVVVGWARTVISIIGDSHYGPP